MEPGDAAGHLRVPMVLAVNEAAVHCVLDQVKVIAQIEPVRQEPFTEGAAKGAQIIDVHRPAKGRDDKMAAFSPGGVRHHRAEHQPLIVSQREIIKQHGSDRQMHGP